MALKQGAMLVQCYTNEYIRRAHFARDMVPSKALRVFHYRNGFRATLRGRIPQELVRFDAVYNAALYAESSEAAIVREAAVAAVVVAVKEVQSTKRSFDDRHSQSSGSKKSSFDDRSSQRFEASKNKTENQPRVETEIPEKPRMCMGCPKPYHPGKNCDGTQRLCYFYKEPGHIATYCPQKKATTTTPPVAPSVAKPKGRIFMMSRAQAEASPHLFTGNDPDDPDAGSYEIDPSLD